MLTTDSAINSWVANGHVNGWNGGDIPIDYNNPDEVAAWATGDLVRTRGIVDIPVCSFEEIATTVLNDKDNDQGNPNYPCPLNNPFCNVPSGCRNALAPDGCAVVCG